MKNRIGILIYLFMPLALFGQDGVPLLKWADPHGSRPGTYKEWISEHPFTLFEYTLERTIYGDGRTGSVAILAELDLAQYLEIEIEQLEADLQNDGYTILRYNISGGTPETLRTFLQQVYDTHNIEGALFIGDLPVPWFEVYDFGGSLTQFPMDLFYMDLDGEWLDTINPGNGVYDGHREQTKPEIYIGRLTTTGIGSDTVLLSNYFSKNHNYRSGFTCLPTRALVFIDDDWYPWALQWANDVSLLFADTVNYWDPDTTRASLYRQRLDSAQVWVSVFAHSWPGGHQFAFNNGNQHDYYYSSEYISQNPPSRFYNFFACSFCRYTTNGYGGGQAIFNENHGVGAIGSTKSGSMLDFNYFYGPLGQGRTLGQAFKYWFECIYDSVGMNFDRLCWHYGMTLLGDPFLKPLGHSTAVAEGQSKLSLGSDLILKSNLVNTQVQMVLRLGSSQWVSLVLYDCIGRPVRQVSNRPMAKGNHALTFELEDNYGRTLTSGIYMIKATIGNDLLTRKIVKID
jgi:hypothetical protein